MAYHSYGVSCYGLYSYGTAAEDAVDRDERRWHGLGVFELHHQRGLGLSELGPAVANRNPTDQNWTCRRMCGWTQLQNKINNNKDKEPGWNGVAP